jgi:hypothetical protein
LIRIIMMVEESSIQIGNYQPLSAICVHCAQ